MKRETKINLERAVKRIFLKLRLHRFFPFSETFTKLVYLAKLSRWCDEQGVPPWNDTPDPEFRIEKRYDLYAHVAHQEGLFEAIDYLEFGVGEGHSFNWWVEHNTDRTSRFVGFDTFTGLPEKWGHFDPGAYSAQGKVPSQSDSRCSFEAGMFQDTLDRFLMKFEGRRRTVIHMDADLYSSTLFVLSRLAPKLKQGDIVFFDEFGVPTHEFRAFTDVAWAFRIRYQLLGAVNNYLHVAFRIL